MSEHVNALGQPIGAPVLDWSPRPRPPRTPLVGRTCRVEPLAPGHAADLHVANTLDRDGVLWSYLPYGPFDTLADYEGWMAAVALSDDPLFHAVIDLATPKSIFVIASPAHLVTAAAIVVVSAVALLGLLYRAERRYWIIEPDALLVILLVIGSLILVYDVTS